MRKQLELKPLGEMNDLQKTVFSMLGVGERNKVTRKELVTKLGMSDEKIRTLIKTLLPFAPVVASFKGGYYIAETPNEIDSYVATLLSYSNSILQLTYTLQEHRKALVK